MFAIRECFEIGMHMLIPLDLVGLLLGAGIQWLLCKQAKKTVTRWLWIGISAVGVLVSDIATAYITGYDRLVPLFVYWFFLLMLIGALACMLVFWRIRKKG